MAGTVICPVCGENNPADMEFCRNCQSRLQPLTGTLKGENAPIQPGDAPTKKVTSELEPLLPQWLRDARQQARESAAEDASKAPSEPGGTPAPSGSDLLAGLESQSQDEEEEVPDWLAHITGASSKKKKPVQDENQVKWVELGHRNEPPVSPLDEETRTPPASRTQGPEKEDLADWFRQAAASSETADFRMPDATLPASTAPESEPQAGEPRSSSGEDLSWLRNLDADASTQPEPPAEAPPPIRDEAPDWLKRMQAQQTESSTPEPRRTLPSSSHAEVPDWLRQFEQETPAPAEPEVSGQEPIIPDLALPDWLNRAETPASQAPITGPEPTAEEPATPAELPDWISSLGKAYEQPSNQGERGIPAPEAEQATTNEPAIPTELPDWISSIGKPEEPPAAEVEQPAPVPESQLQAPGEPFFATELPDWLSSLGKAGEQPPAVQPQAAPPEPTPEETAIPAELPDWISSLGKDQGLPPESPAPIPPSTPVFEAEPQTAPVGLPDWISSLGAGQELPPASPALAEPNTPGLESEQPTEPTPSSTAAFSEDALAGGDVDAIFASMQMPDWLSAVTPAQSGTGQDAPAAAQEEQAIGPAELPSWVQAMRPVESVMGTAPADQETPTEERGPLAGLHGVLPAIPGAAAPSSKPKPHSIKLDATEQQQAHALLLEQILVAETSPIPMKSGIVLRSQRIVRWVIALLVLLLVAGVVFSGTQIFPLPSAVPNETVAAIQSLQAVPADAPVLVVFDYQPSTVGEMEATGASLVENLLLLKHPRLALLSTSPTGSALAERFMSTAMPDLRQTYVRDVQYVDLGYLPGGLAGVHNFAQDPRLTVPLDAGSRPVWQSAILNHVERFSDFAAILVLTDSVESGRTWVEQTQGTRGKSLMVLVSSAQAGPMLLPYVDSGQVNGLISGIYGAVGAEQANAELPGLVRRYWNAYSAGTNAAVLLIVLGGLWNLLLGIRDRRAEAVG